MNARPATELWLDVDGVLNLDCRARCKTSGAETVLTTVGEIVVRLDVDAGPLLLDLLAGGTTIRWFTTWNDAANTHIGPRLGLPRFPVVPVDNKPSTGKFESLVAALRSTNRRVVLVDDDPGRPAGTTRFRNHPTIADRRADGTLAVIRPNPKDGFSGAWDDIRSAIGR